MIKRLKLLSPLWQPFVGIRVNLYAASASFYWLLSILPSSVLFLSIIAYFPAFHSILNAVLDKVIPIAFRPLLLSVWTKIYGERSGTVVSLSALAVVWAASKGVLSITEGLNGILNLQNKMGFIGRRVRAILYFVLLSVSILVCLIAVVFGDLILRFLNIFYPHIGVVINDLFPFRTMTAGFLLALMFYFIYRFLPSKRFSHKYCIIFGSAVSFCWIELSYLFSLYAASISKHQQLYGGIGLLLLVCLWTKLCLSLLFYGAVFVKISSEKSYHPIMIIKRAISK